MRRLDAWQLGRVEYEDGLSLQHGFLEALSHGKAPDSLLLLEHPPVITLGRAAKQEHLLATADELERSGVEVFQTDRGGDVTYHGPGQVVGYPILDLAHRPDVRRYVRDLEATLVRALARFGIEAAHIPKWPGVWVRPESARPEKIAAIGVHLARWKTTHGFALNVCPQLAHFELIVPCGIKEGGVTSMERELGRRVPLEEVELALAESFAEVFEESLTFQRPQGQTVSVAVVRHAGPQQQLLLLQRTPERGGFWQLVTGKVEPGESVAEAAAREVYEETGGALPVQDLEYRHAFRLGEELPPRVLQESAFLAHWDGELAVRMDPKEHQAYAWLSLPEALSRLPFPGLKAAARAALRPR